MYCYFVIVHIDREKESSMATRDLTGEQHGDLVVLGASETKYVSPSGYPIKLWKVKCLKCGKTKEMPAATFRRWEDCGCGKNGRKNGMGRSRCSGASGKYKRYCPVCGKSFSLWPSQKKLCCSIKCAAQLRKIKKRGVPFPKDAYKIAHALPRFQKGPQNKEAKKWVLIDPEGNRYIAVGLREWARKNYLKFFDENMPEEKAMDLMQ